MMRTLRLLCLTTSTLLSASVYADDVPKAPSSPRTNSRLVVVQESTTDSPPPAADANKAPEAPQEVAPVAIQPSANPKPEDKPPAEPTLTTKGAEEESSNVATRQKVFQKPAPTNASHDPRMIAAMESTEAIERTLNIIKDRFKAINKSYEERVKTASDIKTVTEEMKPLVKAARTDIINVMQSAQDLIETLPQTKLGLEASARLFRQKAANYRDPALRKITEAMAEEMERREQDIPRKMRLTSDFILALNDAQALIIETDRCLNDTAAAMKILTAGIDSPQTSIEGVAFRIRIKQYMAILDEYGKNLSTLPEPESAAEASAPKDSTEKQEPKPDTKASPPINPASSDKKDKKPESDIADRKPVPPGTAPASAKQDIFQPETTLRGIYADPTGALPLQVTIRNRQDNRISGDIYVQTASGIGHQRFAGRINDNTFSFHVTYVRGPLMQSPETWQGRLGEENISGNWINDAAEGEFRLNYNPPSTLSGKSNTVSAANSVSTEPVRTR